MSALAESANSANADPNFMQLPRSYETPREVPTIRPAPKEKRMTIKTSICPLKVRVVGDPSTGRTNILTVHDAGMS